MTVKFFQVINQVKWLNSEQTNVQSLNPADSLRELHYRYQQASVVRTDLEDYALKMLTP